MQSRYLLAFEVMMNLLEPKGDSGTTQSCELAPPAARRGTCKSVITPVLGFQKVAPWKGDLQALVL